MLDRPNDNHCLKLKTINALKILFVTYLRTSQSTNGSCYFDIVKLMYVIII